MYLRFGGSFDSSHLLTNSLSSAEQAVQWVQQNGHPYNRLAHDDSSNNEYVFYGSNFTSTEAVVGWDWDTRNRSLFADQRHAPEPQRHGHHPEQRHPLLDRQLSVHQVPAAVQGLDLVVPRRDRLRRPARQHAPAIPPYRQFFGGGPDNVRGFRESLLGPVDQFGNPYGGNMRITSQNELIFPMPAKWAQTARVSLFLDMGGVYQTGNKLQFFGPDNITPVSYQLSNFNDIKRSVGVCGHLAGADRVCSVSASGCRSTSGAATASPPGATRPRSSSSRSVRPSKPQDRATRRRLLSHTRRLQLWSGGRRAAPRVHYSQNSRGGFP